jgi:putative DNA primase/helicase
MIEMARTELEVVAGVDQLDADPLVVNVQNGTLDLRTGELNAHRREDLLTKLAATAFDPDAACPTFEGFLQEIVDCDQELAAWLQRAVGYTLTGQTGEQCLFVLHGEGSNGKTTLLGLLGELLGDYAAAADASSFTTAANSRSVRGDLARLRGARLVRAAEVERGAVFAESLVKQATGEDRIVAAFKFRDEFEYQPAFKLWLAFNDMPAVLGANEAIWRRLRIVPFRRSFPLDPSFPPKLRAELPGILAWAVRGALDWQRHGLGRCTAVERATRAFRVVQDRVGQFVDECCEVDPVERVETADLYGAYQAWEQAHGREPLSDFWTRIDKRSGAVKSHGKRYRTGLRLRREEVGRDA